MRIAIDAMGGDFGPPVTVPASLQSLAVHPGLELVFFGRRREIAPLLESLSPRERSRVSLVDCDEVVEMHDRPAEALRGKKQSSMRVAIDQLARGDVAACVSAGNTGALMAMGNSVLKRVSGIDRPAMCVAFPTRDGHCYLLDLGANVDCSAEHLRQFSLMGSVLSQTLDGVARPRVGLLNIGEEGSKGNEQVKLAARLIGSDQRINYTGYVEADRFFEGGVDVVVCDGFVGNVALKAVEGTARLIAFRGARLFRRNLFTRLMGLLARPVIHRVMAEFNPEAYNGAFFLGLRGVLVKSHGRASAKGFQQAVEKAIATVENRIVEHLEYNLEIMTF